MSGNSRQPDRGIGASIGSTIGNWAEGGLRSLFGSGDYSAENETGAGGGFSVEDNSIVKPLSAANVPLLNTTDMSKDGMMRVKHREFIGDLQTGLAPPSQTIYEYALCPQNAALFPWLSTIAGNFEQWIPHGIVFEFVSTCGNAVSSTNASLGSVSIATQYNSQSNSFKSKSQLLNHYFAVSGKTADNLMHAIECDPAEVQIPIFNTFANGQITPALGDDRLYYLGLTTIWNQGSQSTGAVPPTYTCGELWVTYDISLLKPRIVDTGLLYREATISDRMEMLMQLQTTELGPDGEEKLEEVREERKLEKDALRKLVQDEMLEQQSLYRPSLTRQNSRESNYSDLSLLPRTPSGPGQWVSLPIAIPGRRIVTPGCN